MLDFFNKNKSDNNLDIKKQTNNTNKGVTLLYDAVYENNSELVEILLRSGASISEANDNYLLLLSKIDFMRARISEGDSPLELAFRKNNIEIIKLFTKFYPKLKFLSEWFFKHNITISSYPILGGGELFKWILEQDANNVDIIELVNDIHLKDGDSVLYYKFLEGEQKEATWISSQDRKIQENYQIILNKISLQNTKISLQKAKINKLDRLVDKFRTIKNSDKFNQTAEEYKAQIDNFKETLLSQSNEIKELQNKLIKKEQDIKDLVDSLVSKIESHENKYDIQNKFIKSISSEIEHLKAEVKNSLENNQIEELTLQAKVFQSTLTHQSDKIIELQNKLIKKEEDIKDLINKFVSKINKLEEKIDKQKVVKTKIPFTAPAEKQSIKKDDGIIVKRDSFDDF